MKVEFSLRAEKAFGALERNTRERIGRKLLEISKDPNRYIESLTDIPFDKVRIGNYRLFVKYYPAGERLFIGDIRHRSNAYK
jgi:mRNA-degrading endonuclease RelE of RelBE toxin-antitoxin system